jgi:hypothetical protein
METSMLKRRSVQIILVIVALAILVSVRAANAKPSMSWIPGSIHESVTAGESKTITLSVVADKKVSEELSVSASSELDSIVAVTPSVIPVLERGETFTLTLTIAPTSTIASSTIDGVISLAGKKDHKKYAQPLPVTLEIALPVVAEDGVSLEYPGTWRVDSTARELAETIELVNFSHWLQGGILPPGGAAITVPVFPLPSEPLDSIIERDMKGHVARGISDISVDGLEAKRVESTVELGDGFSENWVRVYVPHQEKLYKFILVYHAGDPQAANFLQDFEAIINDARFN